MLTPLEHHQLAAERLIALHGGDAGYTVTVRDDQVVDDLATGDQTVDPRNFTVPCTVPTPYGPSMVDGTRVLAGDANVWIDPDDPLVTFTPALDMVATVEGPTLPAGGLQYVLRGAPRHAGALELHLRGATGAPA